MKTIGLVPLRNFATVDAHKKIYRSAQPLYGYEYDWMKKVLGIKTIVNLRSESNHDDNVAVAHGIKVIDFRVPDHNIPTHEQVKDFMHLIKKEEDFPLLFHCEHGHGRTSTFCVLVRMAMGWTLSEALREEEEVFHYEFHHKAQKDFLKEYFNKSLIKN